MYFLMNRRSFVGDNLIYMIELLCERKKLDDDRTTVLNEVTELLELRLQSSVDTATFFTSRTEMDSVKLSMY